ncbi:MAG: zinc transport system substrate-binding protein [Gammaproteobacteria bacterium]|jgi:zinc transport system substrate-binding protein
MRTFIILSLLLPFSAMANIKVVTSIEPIHQITSAIMRGVYEPELLIKRQVSAHHFSFRPSHFTLIKNADLMIWIGRDFESGLQRLPDILSKNTRQLELVKALNLQHQNGHIWYSPVLLPIIADKILTALKDIDPTNADLYQSNTDQLIASIQKWANLTRSNIKKAAPRYILDHDFLSHFEQDMGISTTRVLHDSHDQHNGIQALKEIETTLRESPVKCLLINEPSASKIAKNLAREFNLEIHNIRLPSDNQQQQPDLIDSLNRLSDIMQHCH